jgi:nitrite reductase/ring-hydroxylating ferredoxin subunit
VVVLSSGDALVVAALGRLEREGACTLLEESGIRDVAIGSGVWSKVGVPEERPVALVVDLEEPEALDKVAWWRQRLPGILVVGHLASASRERWLAAERAGCDVVTNRGAVALQVRKRLGTHRMGERRLALAEVRDVAGRLGLVAPLDETPVGPVALFNLGSTMACVTDRCPHAGARLSEGSIEEGIITCPRHGSQFELATGDRVRGPSGLPIAVHKIIEDEGRVYLVFSAQ